MRCQQCASMNTDACPNCIQQQANMTSAALASPKWQQDAPDRPGVWLKHKPSYSNMTAYVVTAIEGNLYLDLGARWLRVADLPPPPPLTDGEKLAVAKDLVKRLDGSPIGADLSAVWAIWAKLLKVLEVRQ